jgi:hypothetical protein
MERADGKAAGDDGFIPALADGERAPTPYQNAAGGEGGHRAATLDVATHSYSDSLNFCGFFKIVFHVKHSLGMGFRRPWPRAPEKRAPLDVSHTTQFVRERNCYFRFCLSTCCDSRATRWSQVSNGIARPVAT